MRPVDPRLLRHARAARGYLIFTVGLGLVVTALVLAQAGLLAHALATAARGTGAAALWPTLAVLLAVVAARAVAAGGGETVALRAAATVKSELRRKLTRHTLRLGPAWLGGQQAGEIATLATKGLDALDPYFARYLPQLVLAVVVPVAVVARVAAADWISAVVIAVTLPLIPVFAVLVGLHTKARTQRQWRLLATLGGHFLDVVEGLPTLKLFGRAKAQAQVIGEVSEAHRKATMGTLRVAFLSALVLELAAALATALVAVEVGLRLLAGHLGYQTALLVLLLTPEAYLPLRAVGAQFHASIEGATAAARACAILDTAPPARPPPAPAQARHAGTATCGSSIMLNDVRAPIRPRLAGLGQGEPGDSPGRTDHGDRPERSGQERPAGAVAAVRRTNSGDHRDRRVPLAERPAGGAPRSRGYRSGRTCSHGTVAGNIALGRPDATGRQSSAPPPWPVRQVHRGAARWPGHRAGDRPAALGRGAAADRAGPGVLAGRSAAAARRAHRAPGCHHRGRRPRHARDPDGAPRMRSHVRQSATAPAGPRRPVEPGATAPWTRPALRPPAATLERDTWQACARTRCAGAAAGPAAAAAADVAVLAGAAATGCGIALLATSGFLLARASQHPNILAISIAVVAVRGLSVGRGVFRYAERLASHDAAFRILVDIRVRAFQRLERLAPAGLRTIGPGDLLARLVSDVDATQDLFLRGVAPPVAAVLAGAGAVIACLLILPPAGAALAVGLLAAGALVPWLAAARARRAGQRLAPARGEFTAGFTDLLSGAADLHAFGAADAAVRRTADTGAKLATMEHRAASGMGLGTGLSSAAAGLTVWAVLGLAVAATGTGALTRVPLAVVTLTALAAFEAVTTLPAAAIQLGQARASATRLTAVAGRPRPGPRPGRTAAPARGAGPRQLHGAQVRYEPGGPLALDGVDLDLAAGAAGRADRPSGAGKSTVAAVAAAVLRTAGGQRHLDGADLAATPPTTCGR